MDTPPVCNYEGSDYQTSFWERGGRAYEDAVEEVALKRLLPAGGRRLLELGAGAGRNTPRYTGFDQVTLVDYSLTQLEQAQARLGASDKYRYVAADIYRLPFVPGLFDCATMIRTLHHMADARSALQQARRTLHEDAIFILEFANKQNIKAILRFALGRQNWNPFSPEPIEFAALNFDFHPSTVRSWLVSNQFFIERQLTVSHYRAAFFKKLFPLKLLVWMDSLAQTSGGMWQLSPSVFVRSRAAGAGIPPAEEGEFFHCPMCPDTPLADTPPELICPTCDRRYPVVNGIYDFKIKD